MIRVIWGIAGSHPQTLLHEDCTLFALLPVCSHSRTVSKAIQAAFLLGYPWSQEETQMTDANKQLCGFVCVHVYVSVY